MSEGTDERMNKEANKRTVWTPERYFAYWLSRVNPIGAVKTAKLLELLGSYEAIYNMKKEDLQRLPFLTEPDRKAFLEEKKKLEERCREADAMEQAGIRMLLPSEKEYPHRLKNIYDMPQWLFVKGGIPRDDIPTAAVIGARSCTSYGRQEAEYLGKMLAEAGVSVISGLALGVDGAAHRGVVRAHKEAAEEFKEMQGRAYAILGSGIDVCYPPSHKRLYEAVCDCGGILSEYGPREAPTPTHFPVRNRIISGFADAVIVVEARKRSGSLITADLALEQGKEVFAFPGRRTDPLSGGCNRLIKQGAAMLTEPEELLEFFQIKDKKIRKDLKKSVNGLAKTEKMVYSCLDSNPKHVEDIMKRCRLSVGDCMTALLNLELNGFIIQPVNHHYARKLE